MNRPSELTVEANWDAEAGVWVAESDDVPGLVTEAANLEELERKLSVLIPELLDANDAWPTPDTRAVPLHLIAHRRELLQARA